VRASWLGVALLVGLVFSLLDRVVSSKLLQALLTFPVWCWAFMMASTGNPYFDWHSVPIVDFFRTSWLDNWLEGGGFATAAIASAAHVALATHWLPRPTFAHTAPAESRRFARALLVAACVVLLPVVEQRAPVTSPSNPPYVVRVDPRDPSGVARTRVQWLRGGAWALVAVAASGWLLQRRRARS
jgi:hypothetical protein